MDRDARLVFQAPMMRFSIEPGLSQRSTHPLTITSTIRILLTSASLAALAAASSAFAQVSATWINNAPTGLWTTSTNWAGGVVPNATADTATFNVATIPTLSLGSNIALSKITFDTANQATTTISDAVNTLTITTASFADGIVVATG